MKSIVQNIFHLLCIKDYDSAIKTRYSKVNYEKGAQDSADFFSAFGNRININRKKVLDIGSGFGDTCIYIMTEELWGHLKRAVLISALAGKMPDWPEALIVSKWPEPRPEEGWESGTLTDFTLVQDVVRTIRNFRSEKNVKPGRRIPATLVSASAHTLLRQQAATLAALAGLDPAALLILDSIPARPEGNVALVVGSIEIYLPLSSLVDSREERLRLEKDLAEIQSQIQRLEVLLAGPFAQKAPPAVVQKEAEKLANYQETAEKIRLQLASLGK